MRGIESNGTFPLRSADVLRAVAEAYGGLKARDITDAWGKAPRAISEARRVAYALLHEECWLSWRQVAALMGRSTSGGDWLAVQARKADPAAVEELRAQLRPKHDQGELFR